MYAHLEGGDGKFCCSWPAYSQISIAKIPCSLTGEEKRTYSDGNTLTQTVQDWWCCSTRKPESKHIPILGELNVCLFGASNCIWSCYQSQYVLCKSLASSTKGKLFSFVWLLLTYVNHSNNCRQCCQRSLYVSHEGFPSVPGQPGKLPTTTKIHALSGQRPS